MRAVAVDVSLLPWDKRFDLFRTALEILCFCQRTSRRNFSPASTSDPYRMLVIDATVNHVGANAFSGSLVIDECGGTALLVRDPGKVPRCVGLLDQARARDLVIFLDKFDLAPVLASCIQTIARRDKGARNSHIWVLLQHVNFRLSQGCGETFEDVVIVKAVLVLMQLFQDVLASSFVNALFKHHNVPARDDDRLGSGRKLAISCGKDGSSERQRQQA